MDHVIFRLTNLDKPGGDIVHLGVKLHNPDSLLTRRIVEAFRTAPRTTFQARRSGPCFCLELGDDFVGLEGQEGMQRRADFKKGELVYSPEFGEAAIAYDDGVLFTDHRTLQPSPCVVIGEVITADFDKLHAVGEKIWRQGERQTRIVSSP
jgi:hypothetical protein